MAGCVVKVAHSQKVLCFLTWGFEPGIPVLWVAEHLCKPAIPHTVKVAKSLEADVLEDGGGRLCGEGCKFSEGIMFFILGIRTWDSSTLGSSAVTFAKSCQMLTS